MNESHPDDSSSRPKGRLLDFKSGGYVLVLAAIVGIAFLARVLVPLFNSKTRGDGRNPATYGFEFSNANIPVSEIVAGHVSRDGIRSLVNPAVLSASEAAVYKLGHYSEYLVSRDRVIGVTINGESRAYPLSVIYWHEVVNDTLGGQPILVTCNPLCDSAVVFERRIGETTPEFGVSGLLYNSNLLFYDRQAAGGTESLWSQILGRALTGPAAAEGQRLRVLPSAVLAWAEWRERHPETTVLRPEPEYTKRYRSAPFQSYFGTETLRFPVKPLPSAGDLALKDRVIVVGICGERRVYPFPEIARHVDSTGRWTAEQNGVPLVFHYRTDPETVWVEEPGLDEPIEVIYSFWFAWHAMFPAAVNVEKEEP